MLVNLSIKDVNGLTKEERGNINYYERHIRCKFNLLPKLLIKDYIYNAFAYLGHKRSNYNICSNSNLIILDVDHTDKAMSQVFKDIIEEDLQCIISTTSDKNNLYKYRVLLPLDREVTSEEYNRLVYGLEHNKLVSNIDLSASNSGQMIYSYKDSKILSNFSGLPLCVDDYILAPAEKVEYQTSLDITDLEALIEDFKSYSNAISGSRTRSLMSVGYRLLESGASDKQLESIILHVNSTFILPKSKEEVKRRVINFMKQQRNNI